MAEVLGLSSDCDPAVADSGKESVIARELEAESYRIHGQPQSMGYKMRFRTLKLALKENVCDTPFSENACSPLRVLLMCTARRHSATDNCLFHCRIVGVLAAGVAYWTNNCRSGCP